MSQYQFSAADVKPITMGIGSTRQAPLMLAPQGSDNDFTKNRFYNDNETESLMYSDDGTSSQQESSIMGGSESRLHNRRAHLLKRVSSSTISTTLNFLDEDVASMQELDEASGLNNGNIALSSNYVDRRKMSLGMPLDRNNLSESTLSVNDLSRSGRGSYFATETAEKASPANRKQKPGGSPAGRNVSKSKSIPKYINGGATAGSKSDASKLSKKTCKNNKSEERNDNERPALLERVLILVENCNECCPLSFQQYMRSQPIKKT